MSKLVISSAELRFFMTLDERHRRLYAGLKAKELGWHGVQLVSEAYKIHANTVRRGKKELENSELLSKGGIRNVNTERKKKKLIERIWIAQFEEALALNTAGLPQNDDIRWTNLTQFQIQTLLCKHGLDISIYYVRLLLKLCGYKKRKMLKMNTLKEVEDRNAQFNHIANCRDMFEQKGLPILSIDTKNKELLGDYGRQGQSYSTGTRTTSDHNFAKKTDIKMVPHGIYDVTKNVGYMTLGTNNDTSEFVCDNLERTWTEHIQYEYPDADTMLVLCDGGGSNAAAHYIVKMDLIKLAKKLKINILVAHYPPYCSKWNPIEHRLFAQISRTWDGLSLYNLTFVKELTNTTTTKTGLKVFTTINEKAYRTQRDVPQEFKDNIKDKVLFDDKLAKWNYLIRAA